MIFFPLSFFLERPIFPIKQQCYKGEGSGLPVSSIIVTWIRKMAYTSKTTKHRDLGSSYSFLLFYNIFFLSLYLCYQCVIVAYVEILSLSMDVYAPLKRAATILFEFFFFSSN